MRWFLMVAAFAHVMALPGHVAVAADEPDELMPGHSIVVRPGTLVRFTARPAAGGSFDLPDAANAPTAEGGRLQVHDVALAPQAATLELPAAGWKGLGNPAGSKGYRYRGAGSPADPCRRVLIRPTVVKALCRGDGGALSTPFGGEAAVVLGVGAAPKRYCASFGGTHVKNDASALRRRGAPPPVVCPFVTTGTGGSMTTTSTSTTSTTVPVCCSLTFSLLCMVSSPEECLAALGTIGAPGTVCDYSAGCVTPPGYNGPCCEGGTTFVCAAGYGYDESPAGCGLAGGTMTTGMCTASGCVPTSLEPPHPCCSTSTSAPAACSYFVSTELECIQGGGFPGNVCDALTGTCDASSPGPGNCCATFGGCVAGPVVDEAGCVAQGGVFSIGVCDGQSCVP